LPLSCAAENNRRPARSSSDPKESALQPKEPNPLLILLYHVAFIVIIAAGLVLLGYQYIKHITDIKALADQKIFITTSGYTVVIAGVLVCLLIALLRWRTAEYDDGRRPKFTAGVAVLIIGAAMMLGSLYGN
jgi:hypothetical protein